MTTAQAASNKATFRRLHDVMNTGDAELISKTIDDVVEPSLSSASSTAESRRRGGSLMSSRS
jgi:hypothetical protein